MNGLSINDVTRFIYLLAGIMPHCIDGDTLEVTSEFCSFDGKNWEQEILKKEFVKEMSKDK